MDFLPCQKMGCKGHIKVKLKPCDKCNKPITFGELVNAINERVPKKVLKEILK